LNSSLLSRSGIETNSERKASACELSTTFLRGCSLGVSSYDPMSNLSKIRLSEFRRRLTVVVWTFRISRANIARMTEFRIETSAFTAAGWEQAFYPAGMKPADYLTYYASRVTLNPAIWGHQKSGHSIQPRTNRSLRLFVQF